MTVLEAIQKSTEYLARKGVDSPRLQSELLLAHLLKTERLRLYLDFTRKLPQGEVDSLRELVTRRGEREPLQHILGSTSFWGYEIQVNPCVLIPRPETEMLAELGWKFLRQRHEETGRAPLFLDFGTGSGCISIALAGKCGTARGVAMDASLAAIEKAGQNIEAHQLSDRIETFHAGSLDAVRQRFSERRFDLLISNPPYIPSAEIPQLQEEVRRFDPRQALDGGTDGLDFYRLLAAEGGEILDPAGKLIVEFGDGQEKSLPALFGAENWIVESVLADYTERPRILSARPAAS